MKKFNLVFDIGSNAGNTVEYLITFSNKIIAVEPNPTLATSLKHRFKEQNVEVIQKGLSNTIETKTFHISKIWGGVLSTFESDWITKSRFLNKGNWDSQIQVETTTLDNLIDEWGTPDFVKVDVEGHEYQVFIGLTKPLENTLFGFEWAEEMFDTTTNIVNYVTGLGYTKFSYTYGDSLNEMDNLQFKNWADLDLHNNIDRNRKTNWGMIYFKK